MARAVYRRTREARALRQRQTPAERRAWRLLRNRGLMQPDFRRQHPITGFVADSMCLEHRLVLELDGDHHNTPERPAHDHHQGHRDC